MSNFKFPYLIKVPNVSNAEYNRIIGGDDVLINNNEPQYQLRPMLMTKDIEIAKNVVDSSQYIIKKDTPTVEIYEYIIEALYYLLYQKNKNHDKDHFEKYIDYMTKMIPFTCREYIYIKDVENIQEIYVPVTKRYLYDFDIDIIKKNIQSISADDEILKMKEKLVLFSLDYTHQESHLTGSPYLTILPLEVYKYVKYNSDFIEAHKVNEVFTTRGRYDDISNEIDESQCILS